MASNLTLNETIYVPCKRVGGLDDHPAAIYQSQVVELENRSVKVSLPGGRISDWVATAQVHRHIGICILTIGDFETETGLIDPLSKSVLQFCRLLLPDDSVRFFKVRSVAEIATLWAPNEALYSHVILIGHGTYESIKFGVDGNLRPDSMAAIFSAATTEKLYISLCCNTGYANFGKPFSRFSNCRGLIAPFHSVHGALASQFAQTLLTYTLLEGETIRVGFRHARESVAGTSSFRLWQYGELTAGAR